MKELLISFFREDNGQMSTQRLIFVIGSLFAMVIGTVVWFMTKDWMATTGTVSGIAAVFGGGKVIQKSLEQKKDES